jgi:polyphosphate kinase
MIDRESSLLAFNRRVLAQAARADVPLLERLRYITIVSSNLDEFFEVRFPDWLELVRQSGQGETRQEFADLAAQAHELINEQYRVLNDEVMPDLAEFSANASDREACVFRLISEKTSHPN